VDGSKTRVLLVDKDRELVQAFKQHLSQEGFEATIADNGSAALGEALSGGHDLAVIDRHMPLMDGFELLRLLRSHCNMPIVILSEDSNDSERIIALEMGADDSIPKPCSPGELVARIRAILRRTQPDINAEEPDVISVGTMTIWPRRRMASIDGKPLPLTSTEFSLLELLSRHAGSVISKHDLTLAVLGRPLTAYDRSIDVHISSIRQKLGPRPDDLPWIHTVRGKGYQFIQE
jgi:DNA-binding response OmpR family regulator